MKISEMCTLLKSGYTKAEITDLVAAEKEAEQQPDVKPEVTPEVKPEVKPEAHAGYDEILAQLQKMNTNIEASNILASKQPPEKNADDVLAEMLKGSR